MNNTLTHRQKEILELVSEGLSDEDISQRLVIAKTTVKTHITAIRNSLNLRRRHELVHHSLSTEIIRLRHALDFYGKRENYGVQLAQQVEGLGRVYADGGKLARRILSEHALTDLVKEIIKNAKKKGKRKRK